MDKSTAKELVEHLIRHRETKVMFKCPRRLQVENGFNETRTLNIAIKAMGSDEFEIRCSEGEEQYPTNILSLNSLESMFYKYTSYSIVDSTIDEEKTMQETNQDTNQDTNQADETNGKSFAEEPIQESKVINKLASTQDQLTERIKELVLKNPKQEAKPIKVGRGCKKCNYTGWIVDAETGLTIRCDCQSVSNIDKTVKSRAPQVKIKNTNALTAVVPLEYRNKDFDLEKAKICAGNIAMSLELKVVGYNNYIDTLSSILTSINTSELKNSYIIGAPNGFGKATFVYTAIKRLIAQGKPVVPYLPLIELAELRVEYEDRLLSKLKNPRFSKSLRENPDEYIWKDFVDVPVLFTYFSSVDSKVIESATLSTLMNLRSVKGKPTVVMISSSLDPYISDLKLRQYYWNDMIALTNKESTTGVDRLIHRSCFMRAVNSMNIIKGVDY